MVRFAMRSAGPAAFRTTGVLIAHTQIMVATALAGYELLATAIVIADWELYVHYANAAAENLFDFSAKNFVGHTIPELFQDSVLDAAVGCARTGNCTYTEHELRVGAVGRAKLHPVSYTHLTLPTILRV